MKEIGRRLTRHLVYPLLVLAGAACAQSDAELAAQMEAYEAETYGIVS